MNIAPQSFTQLQVSIKDQPRMWLITGVAGFIGSNLLETLLKLDQHVIGLDNFSTGYRSNLDDVARLVTEAQLVRFNFVEVSTLSKEAFAILGVTIRSATE